MVLTYCRNASHDKAYFKEPVKLLDGKVDPPAFNLKNEILVSKHVHSSIITRLYQLSRDKDKPEDERHEIVEVLRTCLPNQINSYLFETNGTIRLTPFDVSPLHRIIQKYIDDLLGFISLSFQQGWPNEDRRSQATNSYGNVSIRPVMNYRPLSID